MAAAAAATAANIAMASAAARLKAGQEHELKTALDVPRDVLQDLGWDAYSRGFLRLRDHNDWAAGLLDTTTNAHGQLTAPWNVATETEEERQDRKNIFLILCSITGTHSHLLNGVANGDAQDAWRALCE